MENGSRQGAGVEAAYDGQVKATPENPEAELEALLANPCTHDWTTIGQSV